MYIDIDLSKLPSKGIYYKKDSYIKIRPLSNYESLALKSMNNKNLQDQIKKLEFCLLSIDSNLDEFDMCYTDVFYVYYLIYKLTYPEIIVDFNGEGFECDINEEDFIYSNPNFSKIEDLFYKDIKFYLPSLYNMSKAYQNILNLQNSDKHNIERLSIVPYMQREKISDKALEIINEHLLFFSDNEIKDFKDFLNEKENVVLGQKITFLKGEDSKELLITLNQLI